jgi:aspartyl-tRNA(Asn)/glutamyl-tRNA(Gln) amidotransferase subunit B
MTYQLTIGLEVHARINTKSKLFCSCDNNTFNAKPNTHICPICTAQPGQLPQVNYEAIKKAILTGHALNAEIPNFSKFDRKSYFYPDSPKGYQITQFDKPIVKSGTLEVLIGEEKKKFRIHRIHIEDDAGKLIHSSSGTLVDLNRTGSPLMEIVTEPDFHSTEEVSSFLKELQKVLRYIGVSDADMEKGMMRADVNISLSKNETLGTRVEIKNMNSFAAIEKAIDYEQKRQAKVLDEGGNIDQETRGWDTDKLVSVIQRSKEDAADYRYFPEPDLPPLIVSDEEIAEIKKQLVEMPLNKYERFREEYQLPHDDAYILTETRDLADYYEEVVRQSKQPKKAANWILSELLKFLKEDHIDITKTKVSAEHLAEIICMVEDGIISGKIGKEIFPEVYETGKNPTEIVEEKGLKQNSNLGELEAICKKVLDENQALVEQYKSGKDKLFGAFVGKVMKETQGQANPQLINEILKKLLK